MSVKGREFCHQYRDVPLASVDQTFAARRRPARRRRAAFYDGTGSHIQSTALAGPSAGALGLHNTHKQEGDHM